MQILSLFFQKMFTMQVLLYIIVSGRIKEEMGNMAKRLDLVGQRFGRLVVVSLNEEVTRQKGRTYWNCKCDCSNEKVVRGQTLKRGTTTSCGCYQKEKASSVMRDVVKKQWEDEGFRRMQSEKMRGQMEEQWKDEEYRQMHSGIMKKLNEEQWKNEEYRQMHVGENHPGWKGGVTPIKKHLEGLPVVSRWFDDSKKQVNYTCELTGKVGCKLHTHHLKAFSTIVLEAHELHNIRIKPQVKDYTEEELHKLEEYVTSWHKDTSNAVVLCKEVHDLFHNLYKYGGNTPEQFKEFKERYIAGEFKDLI